MILLTLEMTSKINILISKLILIKLVRTVKSPSFYEKKTPNREFGG